MKNADSRSTVVHVHSCECCCSVLDGTVHGRGPTPGVIMTSPLRVVMILGSTRTQACHVIIATATAGMPLHAAACHWRYFK